ncbi:hypothetical protein [Geoalkalibacter sp.]|uniref:hypothetical protein n=1 Tax=Geoalkalibacter sp. TaxID=3041440 RepID=UPI00272E9994|nr:hypothetical protein [Geoalkalibacter sp.]
MLDKDLEVCRTHLKSAVLGFRLGMEGQANEDFVAFLDAFARVCQQYPPHRIVQLNAVLEKIFQAQSRKDYLYLADLLEYGELVPAPLDPVVRMGDYH